MSNPVTYRGPALPVLHEEYAKEHQIDELAPIHGRREILVNAPVRRVWRILSDVPNWADTLEPGVKNIQLDHGVRVDAPFRRSNKGARMNAQFAVLHEDHEIAWTGSAFGAKAVHRFLLHAVDEKTTRVVVEESMAGPLLGLYFNIAKLTTLLEASLHNLKTAAERP